MEEIRGETSETGKLTLPKRTEATTIGNPKPLRLLVNDKKSGMSLLVDTGSDVSVLPKSWSRRRKNTSKQQLFAANGSVIHTYGTRILELNLGLRRQFTWQFIIADVSQPILGADFLYRYDLMVDLRNRRLVDGITNLNTPGKIVRQTIQSISILQQNTIYNQILREFVDITRPMEKKKAKHHVEHRILTKFSLTGR